jgi:hypothetical protein
MEQLILAAAEGAVQTLQLQVQQAVQALSSCLFQLLITPALQQGHQQLQLAVQTQY